MSKQKLLYIASHLSTGGMPQYLLKQIQIFKTEFDIEVVEVNNHSGDAFVVQKNQIADLCKLYTLGDNKSELVDIIKSTQPNIIHFTEIPEHFLSHNILDTIFDNSRNYYIVASTHGSHTNPNEIKYHPDRYVLVSEWSRRRFELVGVDTRVWDYPIETIKYDKVEFKNELGFESDWKHVLMVGLFTEGKNQGEIFNVARLLEKYKIKFHFIGNQAMNFESYWGPLMNQKPDNCIIWGERSDVDKFYKASDMFYFSSKLELNPLSIKEALGYGLPSIFRKLHTYLDSYDNNELVTYIDDNLNQTKQIILEKLQPEFNEIPGWFSYEHLYNEMVENGTDGDVFVELGAWLGKSTNHMATLIKDSNKDIKFTTVDTWKGTDGEEIHNTIVNGFGGDIFSEFMENTILSNNSKSFNVIKDTSENASSQFQNNSIDFIMLDAGHTYDSLKSDLNLWYHKVKPGGVISGDDYGGSFFPGVTKAADEFFYNQSKHVYRSFVRKKPKIQIKHLMTKPNDLREQISSESLRQLESYGMVYHPIVNTPYDGVPPSDFCKRPTQISDKPGNFGNGLGPLTGRHYGCFNAHRGALESMDDEFDYTLVFEADAFIFTGLKEFVEAVHKACFISERDDVYFIGLSNNNSRQKERIDELFSKTASNQDLAHAYLIPNRTKSWWIDRFNDTPWEGYDLWLTDVFNKEPKLRYTTNKVYVKQADGFSLIDREVKKWN
jgi:hypothetical protein